MREFNIYSTKQSKWYSYVTPDPRMDLCHTIVSAQDSSSHQIIIYGGTTGAEFKHDSTVWVLSMPSFDWVQLAGNATDSTRQPGMRLQPLCTLVGNKYMLSWGRRHYLKDDTDAPECDDAWNVVYLLDITKGQWVDQFQPGQEYLVPDEVVQIIGGTYVSIVTYSRICANLPQRQGRRNKTRT